MTFIRRGLAVLLASLLAVSPIPVSAEEIPVLEKEEPEAEAVQDVGKNEIYFNTGNHAYKVSNASVSGNVAGDACFGEDGSYTIHIPEENPFFPYEVQFTYNGEKESRWFMTPDDSVEIGGHTFYVSAYFDRTAVTQMSLNVAGDTVVVYPEKKEFEDGSGIEPLSLLPLEERNLWADFSSYTPAEMSKVSIGSVFTGNDKIENTDKIIWRYANASGYNYEISESGDELNLSYGTYESDTAEWEMIVGEADQLALDNIRYNLELKITPSMHWMRPVVYVQDSSGKRQEVSVNEYVYCDYDYFHFANLRTENKYPLRVLDIEISDDGTENYEQAYVGLDFDSSIYSNPKCASVKISRRNQTEGGYEDITGQICNQDMSQTDAGDLMQIGSNALYMIDAYDADGRYIGYVNLVIRLSNHNESVSAYVSHMEDGNGRYAGQRTVSEFVDGCNYYKVILYEEYASDCIYYLTMGYRRGNHHVPSAVTAAYEGQYSSIAEANAAGAADIKDILFDADGRIGKGYAADYSKGVYFTVFEGGDGTAGQKISHCCVQTERGTVSFLNRPSNGIIFDGLKRIDGTDVPCYVVPMVDDSYGARNFCTILVGENEELTNLAPVFSAAGDIRLYTADSGVPETSGVSSHDFSRGPVMYTAAVENGTGAKNYWLQVIKAERGTGRLYINSLKDGDARTREEGGVIYSTREVMLDSYHYNWHDILLINTGTEAIPDLSAELESDVVELDDYWTLNGNYGLAGFRTVEKEEEHGQLQNFAQLRIRAKRGVEDGTEISGTLTIKSGTAPLMVLTLTGTVGNPHIITEELPQELKCTLWVPYGTMIQNNNKYNWNRVSYSLADGRLPAGMEMRANGELYGVPGETGEFTFTVRMTNSAGSFPDDTKTYTLLVEANTDENVEAATDSGYELVQRVPDIREGGDADSYLLVSAGAYEEFTDVYLDGMKLKIGEDYNSEAGSTRITIKSQTLAQSAGMHTLGIEFRTKDTGALRRAAQNYTAYGIVSGDRDEDREKSGDGEEDNSSGDSSLAVSAAARAAAVTASTAGDDSVILYIVSQGDTLWKIAEKFYGSGNYWQWIFADNAAIISNPDQIYAGQTIVIYKTRNISAGEGRTESKTYTVEKGDTLWEIAKKVYGKGWQWRKIYQANGNVISDPGQIRIGQVLNIPE